MATRSRNLQFLEKGRKLFLSALSVCCAICRDDAIILLTGSELCGKLGDDGIEHVQGLSVTGSAGPGDLAARSPERPLVCFRGRRGSLLKVIWHGVLQSMKEVNDRI